MDPEKWRQAGNWEDVQAGSAPELVRKILGDPRNVDQDSVGGHEDLVWYYGPRFSGGQIEFHDGRVISRVPPDWERLDADSTADDAPVEATPQQEAPWRAARPYLPAPHIELGFYWHSQAEDESFRHVLGWLLGHGYRLSPYVLAVRSQQGHTPRFADLTNTLPRNLHGKRGCGPDLRPDAYPLPAKWGAACN